ncbi:type VI secretion system baseplate subunit TssG [Coralloluteibacterium thermophilus]|uniref:Type VI secretion system baseplate subunit TssG n=1 Tax=Coralloluteibacterium thermophilum TaxID=2707049 RepID=A0ABV9NRZ9_9GAMM
MAGPARHPPDRLTLEAALRAQPEAFGLFEALRLLERAHPDRPRLGRSARPADDPVRLRQTPSLGFAPREIDRYEPGGEGAGRLDTFVLGLFGPQGPLPLHLTEYAIDRRLNAKDPTFAAFADVFHHRILSLFYRAWADAQPTVQAERAEDDRFRFYLGALVGLTRPRAAGPVAEGGARFYAGRLLPAARSAEGLQRLVEHAFGVPVQVIEFVPEWMRLPDEALLRLGGGRDVASLGRTTVMGRRVRGTQQRFRLRIGPVRRRAFGDFLPGGDTLRQLAALVRGYVGDEKAWDLQLVLAAGEVPATRLGRAGRMGLDTWMGRRAWDLDDADDVLVHPDSVAARRRAATPAQPIQ